MTAEHTGTERARSKTIERWSAYLEELHERIAHRFLRPEVRTRVYRYLAGLLGEVERKNSWQKAEAIGEVRQEECNTSSTTPAGTQTLFAMTSVSMS